MKKKLAFILMFLISLLIVVAGSLNLGRHTERDFGVMQPREIKTMGYYVMGYYEEDEVYYSVCVDHLIEGEIKDWIRLKLHDSQNQNIYPGQKCNGRHSHWVGPELIVTWIKNVFVTVRVPKGTLPGNYTATVNNIACSPIVKKSGTVVNVCNSGPTTINVEVIK